MVAFQPVAELTGCFQEVYIVPLINPADRMYQLMPCDNHCLRLNHIPVAQQDIFQSPLLHYPIRQNKVPAEEEEQGGDGI